MFIKKINTHSELFFKWLLEKYKPFKGFYIFLSNNQIGAFVEGSL